MHSLKPLGLFVRSWHAAAVNVNVNECVFGGKRSVSSRCPPHGPAGLLCKAQKFSILHNDSLRDLKLSPSGDGTLVDTRLVGLYTFDGVQC